VAVATGVVGWLGAQFSQAARLQKQVNDALHLLMEQLQTQHALDAVRISELQKEVELVQGELRLSKQSVESLKAFVRRSGLKIPGEG
jgi:hypothetical protein